MLGLAPQFFTHGQTIRETLVTPLDKFILQKLISFTVENIIFHRVPHHIVFDLFVSRRQWKAAVDRKLGDLFGHHAADDGGRVTRSQFAPADQNPLCTHRSCCPPGQSVRVC